jgi:hypothetical protein
MTPGPAERQLLSDRVRAEFSAVPRPQREDDLGGAIDPGWPETLQTFLGKSWDEVRLKKLLRHRGDPFYEFTDGAFVYYLQSYLKALLGDPSTYRVLLEDLAWQFRPEDDSGLRHAALLSTDQRQAVADVMAAYRDIADDDNCDLAVMLLRGEL